MAGYGDRAASILDSKQGDESARDCAKSAISAISPPPDSEPGGAISAESAKSPLVVRRDALYARLDAGDDMMIAREVAGQPIPHKWLAEWLKVLTEYQDVCDELAAASATQPELFAAPVRYV